MPAPRNQGRLGRYETTIVGGEKTRAFIPPPLPPVPPIEIAPLLGPLERAQIALGRLDGMASLLPDTRHFLSMYVRKEALLSSQIEGTQSSLSDLLLYEPDEAPGVPIDDVAEVSCYVAALNRGLELLRGGLPLSLRLIREIHAMLLSSGRGAGKQPGEFRTTQNWAGGPRPSLAAFVPPPPQHVLPCLGDLERFIHAEAPDVPTLVQAGLMHVQFETIHPFLDGNGRLGRLPVTFLLCERQILREPILYLSLHLKTHRQTYYDLLQRVREHGDWEAWLRFFLDGVAETAESATDAAGQILALFAEDRTKIETLGRSSGSALRLHDLLKARPLLSIATASKKLNLSHPTIGATMARLVELGILRETTGRQRNRLYAYGRYIDILSAGTEPLEQRPT
jgi:Fic family protein